MTPVSTAGATEPGVLVHAALTEDRILGYEVRETPPLVAALLGCAIVALTLRLQSLGGRARLAAEAGLLLVPATVACGLFVAFDLALPIVTLALAAAAPVIVIEATTAATVHAAAGRAANAMGASPDAEYLPPEARVRRLEQLAAGIREKELLDAEARRVLVHELKTPLTSIRGMSQLLADFDLDDAEKREFTGIVRQESERLATMIERLLDLERLGVRSFEDTTSEVDLEGLTLERVRLAAAGSGRVIEADVAPCVVRGDRLLLGRVLDNLLGNALKFSPEGSPIHLRASSGWGLVTIEIEDAGPGVLESERDAVFRRFSRGSSSQGKPGLGLGLALVAEAVTWHRGTVSVENGASGGALFRITLPATDSNQEAI